MATKTWVGAADTAYFDPGNWLTGLPGLGDTAVIAPTGTGVAAASLEGNGIGASGYFLDSQTVDLLGGTAGARLDLNRSALGPSLVVNTIGVAALWLNNYNTLRGAIHVGAGAPSTLTMVLFPTTDDAGPNGVLATVNVGTIYVGDGSTLDIQPISGGVDPVGGFNPTQNHVNFYNGGYIGVLPGGTLIDQSPSLNSGVYFTDLINDSLISVLGAAGKTTSAGFDANVRSSSSFVPAYDTPLGQSIPANGAGKQGTIKLDGGTGVVSARFTGNVSDQTILMHNAVATFANNEIASDARAWNDQIVMHRNSSVLLQPNYTLVDYPVESKPGDPDYTRSVGFLGDTITGFALTDTLDAEQSGFDYANCFWDQASHALKIEEGIDLASVQTDQHAYVDAVFFLAGNYRQSDFKISFVPNNSFSGRWEVTTTSDANALDPAPSNAPAGASEVAETAEVATGPAYDGRDTAALFDANYYLAQNPDVRAAGVDPLKHFETVGWKEGRDPSLLFSDSKYLAAYPDVAKGGLNPLLHYLEHGQAEGRMTFLSGGAAAADPLVQSSYYDPQLGAKLVPTGVAAEQQAAFDYDATGWQKGLDPDAWFDTDYYLSHNPDVAAAHIDPLLHYETYGWKEGRDPSAQFSTTKYLGAYADVRAAGVDPLLHFVAHGQAEGRTAFSV